jgi:predicted ATP-grasp superfamily ATP-dependent carboligase
MMNAIVLDGEQRSALAVTRSLGRRGIRVAVGAEKKPSLSSCSRFCTESFIYTSPYQDPAGFLRALIKFASRYGPSVMFPMTDVTLTEILLHRNEFPENIVVPFDDYQKYMQVTDKLNLFRIARDLNVPAPSTLFSTDYDNMDKIVEGVIQLGFPVVVKPGNSKIRTVTGWVDGKVHYATGENALRQILANDIFMKYPFLIQKRIHGPGIGIFLLMKDGEVIAKFAHRRIREKPPSGGVSVLSESTEPPEDAMESAVRILEKVRWTGVAMVEFKVDIEENISKLLEVNARFWGSLQLSVSSGVDFPYMVFRLAMGERIMNSGGYKVGLRSRWELGDLDHLLIRLLKNPSNSNLPSNPPKRLTVLKEFLFDFFRPSVRNEVLQLHDIKPFFHEMKTYVKYCFR